VERKGRRLRDAGFERFAVAFFPSPITTRAFIAICVAASKTLRGYLESRASQFGVPAAELGASLSEVPCGEVDVSWTVESVLVSTYRVKTDLAGIEGLCRVDEAITNPTWANVQALIANADGTSQEVSIDGPNGYGMTIGGGPNHYYVSAIGNDMGPYDLLGPDPSEEQGEIIIGGSVTYMPRRFFASREQALQAATFFFEHGSVDPSMNWQLC
jgi:hypothetical protein